MVTVVGKTKIGSKRAIVVEYHEGRTAQQFKAVDAVVTAQMRPWNLE